MRNQTTIDRVALLHPKVKDKFAAFITDAEEAMDITLLMVQGGRTFAQQQAIYDQGRTTPGKIVTKAKPGQSYHNYFLAGDLVPFKVDNKTLDWEYNFELLVPFAAKYGITWGGYFPSPDRDHFECKFGHSWQDLLAMYNAGRFINGTNYVDI